MPDSIKDIEELSRLIDELNSGICPQSDQKDTAELLAVAALIKGAAEPVRPPQHILDQTVDRIIDSVPTKRPERKPWRYYSALGTAASLLLIAGLTLMPSWTQSLPSATPPVITIVQNIPPANPGEKQPPLGSQTAPNQPAAAATVREPVHTAGANVPIASETLPAPTAPTANLEKSEQAAPPSVAKSNPTAGVQAPLTDIAPSRKWAASPPSKPKSPAATPTTLSLPGQTPDSIIIDPNSGTVLQVFYKGTSKELLITQRALTKESPPTKAPAAMIEAAEETLGGINKVTLVIHDQEVIIEGHQSKQDLLTLAKSLAP